jgi:hypothetical protein
MVVPEAQLHPCEELGDPGDIRVEGETPKLLVQAPGVYVLAEDRVSPLSVGLGLEDAVGCRTERGGFVRADDSANPEKSVFPVFLSLSI